MTAATAFPTGASPLGPLATSERAVSERGRRVAAIVLPRFACELALANKEHHSRAPLAVVFSEDGEEESAAAEVGAVCERARAAGVRPGMRVAEAMARTADLRFERVSPRALVRALGTIAEVAMEFGVTVSISLHSPPLDTVWVDVTGAAHLFGGEASLADEIESRIAVLGHRARVAIAGGPNLARAFARFADNEGVSRVSPPGRDKEAVLGLPTSALPLPAGLTAYFARLGVHTVADLARLERAQLVARLEAFTATERLTAPPPHEVLAWLEGQDPRPLVPYAPPEVLVEEVSFEDGVETAPQLVFALRNAVSKLSARLVGRRQATSRIDLEIAYDRAIFRLRPCGAIGADPVAHLFVDLPAPLSHTDDLFRAVKAKTERMELAAPAVRITLALSRIARAPEVQLDLSRDVTVSPDALPALLSELSAEIGTERVGVLSIFDDHRPERRTHLVGVTPQAGPTKKAPEQATLSFDRLEPGEPTRLLPEPVVLSRGPLAVGETIFVGRDAYVVERVTFDRRLDSIAWWSKEPCSRDYFRVSLAGPCKADAWVFVDRSNGETRLHGWWE